jgi:hypothetical protein
MSSLVRFLKEKLGHRGFIVREFICKYSYIEIHYRDYPIYPILHLSFPIYNRDLCEMSLCYQNRLYGYTKRNPHLKTFQDIYYEIIHFFFKYRIVEDIMFYPKSSLSLQTIAFYRLSTIDIQRLRTEFFLILL